MHSSCTSSQAQSEMQHHTGLANTSLLLQAMQMSQSFIVAKKLGLSLTAVCYQHLQ